MYNYIHTLYICIHTHTIYILYRLYSNSQYKPKYNIFFVLTGGGKLNYFGTKYFIEDMLEDSGITRL